MNVGEGTRRLALLLGVAGSVLGGYASMLALIDIHGRKAPTDVWEYLSVPLCPIIGFLVAWGVTRAIGWVVTGFVEPSR